jgi:hypothetical protein
MLSFRMFFEAGSMRAALNVYATRPGAFNDLAEVTGLILSPVFHRVMHQLHLPDDDDAAQRSSSEAVAHEKSDKPKPKPRAKAKP